MVLSHRVGLNPTRVFGYSHNICGTTVPCVIQVTVLDPRAYSCVAGYLSPLVAFREPFITTNISQALDRYQINHYVSTLILKNLLMFIDVHTCVPICVYVYHINTEANGKEKRNLVFLELELYVAVSYRVSEGD